MTQQQGAWNAPPPGWNPPPPPKRKRGLLISLIATGLVMVLGGVLLVVLLNQDDPTGQPAAAPGSATSGAPAPAAQPGQPGWQTHKTGSGALFDVPPSWQVTMEKGEKDVLFPKARFRPGFCPGSPAAVRGVAYPDGTQSTTDPKAALTQAVDKEVGRAFKPGTAQASRGPIEQVDKATYRTTVTVQVSPSSPCDAPAAVLHVVAGEASQGVILFVVWGDQQTPDAPSGDDLVKIAGSFRYDR